MRKTKIVKKKNINLMGIDVIPTPVVEKITHPCETPFAAEVNNFKSNKTYEERYTTKEAVIKKLFNVEV